MKKSLVCVIGAAVLLSGSVAMAQDANAPPPSGKSAATQSMPSMAQMDEHMKKMQALHDRMMGAATPEERQKAMEEGRKEMQESMGMMNQMMKGGMMGGGMMAQKGKPADSNAQMQMMSKRMDMMQMMMQMMMDQQGMMAGPKGAPPAAPK